MNTILVDATALRPGSPVTLAGIEVGKVDSVTLTDDNRALVAVVVRADVLKRLHRGAHFDATYLPDFATPTRPPRRLIIEPGAAAGPLLDDGAFVTCTEESFQPLVSTLEDESIVRDLPRALAALVPELREMAHRTNAFTEGLEHSTVGHILGAKPENPRKH